MANQINIDVQERKTGKRHLKITRAENLVPVVIYGAGRDNQFGAVPELAFRKGVLMHENSLFSLNFKGKSISALVRNLDLDHLNSKIVHADFYAVNMNEKVDATVTIKFVGTAIGIKEGGVLNKSIDELNVYCLPTDIPEDIEVDVSALNIDDRLLVSDLNLPANVEILHEPDQTLVSVAMKAEEPEEEVEAVEASAEGEAKAEGSAEAANGSDDKHSDKNTDKHDDKEKHKAS